MPRKHINHTNSTWKRLLRQCMDSRLVVKPRGQEVREVLGASYRVPMPAFIDLNARKVNKGFMFAEASWILRGSNRLSDITPFMKGYAAFSDDGLFMRGAYGPKVVDQLPYVVESLLADKDTRQAVLTIWRERPGPSKDIPCTVSIQFLVRENRLNLIVYMRSQDVVLGYTYDVFTFSAIAEYVRRLLRQSGTLVKLGDLRVMVGSLHLYERHYKDVEYWMTSGLVDGDTLAEVKNVLGYGIDHLDLITGLSLGADNAKV